MHRSPLLPFAPMHRPALAPVSTAIERAPTAGVRRRPPRRWPAFAVALLLLTAMFGVPLAELIRSCWTDEMRSHIPLVPAVTLWLIWLRRRTLPSPDGGQRTALAFTVGALVVLAAAWILPLVGLEPPDDCSLALLIAAYVLLVVGLVAASFGRGLVQAAAGPLGFLAFAIPPPELVTGPFQTLLQHGSLAVARSLFALSGTPVLVDRLTLQLPGITIEVAPQCSGIHSTLALTLTAVAASLLFLRSRWKQLLLVSLVFPLALLRNGLRIFVVGYSCVEYGPHMIHSDLHVRGGPWFFALSLVPFGATLWWLLRTETLPRSPVRAAAPEIPCT